jgi:hypothetical protein
MRGTCSRCKKAGHARKQIHPALSPSGRGRHRTGVRKKITHFNIPPPGLEDLERIANIHRWLQPRGRPPRCLRYSRPERITCCTRPAWAMRLRSGERCSQGDVNAADETGWTAMMVAAAAGRQEAASASCDGGARIDRRDHHGGTALIGAAAVRYAGRKPQAASDLHTRIQIFPKCAPLSI